MDASPPNSYDHPTRDRDDDSDEEESRFKTEIGPGPGSYATHDSTFRKAARPQSLQFFGSNVQRFNEKPLGCGLGPG